MKLRVQSPTQINFKLRKLGLACAVSNGWLLSGCRAAGHAQCQCQCQLVVPLSATEGLLVGPSRQHPSPPHDLSTPGPGRFACQCISKRPGVRHRARTSRWEPVTAREVPSPTPRPWAAANRGRARPGDGPAGGGAGRRPGGTVVPAPWCVTGTSGADGGVVVGWARASRNGSAPGPAACQCKRGLGVF